MFRLTSSNPDGGDISLAGTNIEITIFPFVFYTTVINDERNNFFRGEILQDYSVSVASGIGYNGEHIQFMIGRDSRYFTGFDGGAVATIGFQF